MVVFFVLMSPVWGVSHSRSKEVAVESEVMARLGRICDEEDGVVHRRRGALRLARSRSGRGLLERMAQREVINEMNEEVKKHEEARA